MAYIGTKDYFFEAAKGNNATTVVHKFGRNIAVGTSFVPVAIGGVYPTPTAAVSLEFVSSDTADALDDTGMHEIVVIGLDAAWQEQTITTTAHATDGLTPVSIDGTWLRVYRAYVSKSGAYGTLALGSHVGDITIRVAGAGATYATISATNYPRGQTEIGAYTVPSGKAAYISLVVVNVDSAKVADIVCLQRQLADDTASSYEGTMRVVFELGGIAGGDQTLPPVAPFGPFTGPCDIGFIAKVDATTGEIDVDFELLLEELSIFVRPTFGGITFTGFAPDINVGWTIYPGAGSVALTGFAPDVIAEIRPSAGTIVFTGYAPDVISEIRPSFGSITFTGFAPTVT